MIDEKKLRELVSDLLRQKEGVAYTEASLISKPTRNSLNDLREAEQALIDYVLANSLQSKPVMWADRQADGRPDPFCIFPDSLATDEMRGPWNWIPLYMKETT